MEGEKLYDGYIYEKAAEGWIRSYSYYEEGEKKEEVEFCRKGRWNHHYLKGELETMIEILDEEGRRTELKEVYLLGILLKQTKRNKETGLGEYKEIKLSNAEKDKLKKEFLEDIIQE